MTTTTSERVLGPVAPEERLPTLDILRGFALLGILLVNFFGVQSTGLADRVADHFLEFFVSGKFYPLFSFLFGLGFGVQLLRARGRGAPVVPVYVRRMAVLALLGVVHFVLLWDGDILRDYALLGLVLILFRNRSPRFLLAAALACLVVASAPPFSVAEPPQLSRPDPETAYLVQLERAVELEALREAWQGVQWARADGTYVELVAARAHMLVVQLPYFFSSLQAQLFAMFLLGLYAAKRRLFEDVRAHATLARRVVVVGGVVGLTGNFLLFVAPELAARGMDILPEARERFSRVLWIVSGPALSLTYAAGFALLCARQAWLRRLSVLAPVGRMGLTNYLLQSVVGTTLYYGYTFGLYERMGPALGVALSCAVFACQIPLSHWWMARYRFGPAEWVWRSLTYGRAQPMALPGRTPDAVLLPNLAP